MKIAIIGATSQIAKDFISQCSDEHALLLFSRKTKQVEQFMFDIGYKNFVALDYGVLKGRQFYVDAVINFVGVGDPARLAEMKGEIFEVTKKYDEIALQFLRRPDTKYIFLSSGAAYGGTFDEPARYGEKMTYPQEITPQHYYGLAKWMAEIKHRTMFDKHIVDLRVFSYFSHTQPLNLKFMIMEMMQAILRQRGIDTTPYAVDDTDIVRDYIGPEDLHRLIFCILEAPGFNGSIDAYTKEPISKHALLRVLDEFYGLDYIVTERIFSAPTGIKPNYYSEYYKASALGYQPQMTSLETILKEAGQLLERHDPGSQS
jgi:nucleoside-diphosphate-sugar epimerase